MKHITIHNYEAFLLDFMEGNLSSDLAKDLQLFLEAHPEIDADIFDLNDVKLNPETVHFDAKQRLQRDENIHELSKQDALLIGLLEDTLNVEEKAKAKALIRENPEAAKAFELYKKTRLFANTALIFENKEVLKKHARIVPMYLSRYVAIAAVFAGLLFLVLANLNKQHPIYDPEKQLMSENNLYFDDDNSNHLDAKEPANQSDNFTENQLAYQQADCSKQERQTNASHEENIVASMDYIKIKRIPKLNISGIQAYPQDFYPVLAYQPVRTKLDWKTMNITYVEKTPLAAQPEKLKMPESISELDETFEELGKRYNPIIKLREAKEELFAANVDELFRREK
jgi:hypothetical protein